MKAVFRGELIVLNAYIMKEQRSKINMPSFHLREQKEEQVKSKVNTRTSLEMQWLRIHLPHRDKEQTFGLCGRRRGWDDLRE